MVRRNSPTQNYVPSVVSQRIIQQALHDMKQQLIHQINKQTQSILNILLTNIRAKIDTQLTELNEQNKHMQEQLTQSRALYQKIAGDVQHLHEENEHLRSQLEIMHSKNHQYLQEVNISKNELYSQKNLIFQQQLQKMELQKKVILYQDKIDEIQTQINRVTHLYEKERERNQELEVLLKSLDSNLKHINRKYDQQQSKYEQLSVNLSHKEEKIKQLKLIIEQSEYLSSMFPKTREKYNFRMSSQNNQSLQHNQRDHQYQQRVKLSQSGYPLSRQLLFQMSRQQQQKNDPPKEDNVTKKMKEVLIKKANLKKIQKEKPLPIKEQNNAKKAQSVAKKYQSEEKEKGHLQLRKRLNTIFTDRVKYRVDFNVKMESLKCQLNQKQKQCEKLNKMLHAKSSDKNSSSFIKKSFQNSRTISKNSQKEIKNAKKEKSSKRKKEKMNRSASQILSEASQLSNSKIIQNFQQFEAECMDKSHSKKEDQFQEFGLSPDKMRHHYLNSEIDVQQDISFKMLQKNLDQSADLSAMDIRSRGNENILDYSLQQLHAAEINNSTSNICKMDAIKEVEENRSPNTPIILNKFSQELDALYLNEEIDERKNDQNKSEQKDQDISILQPKKVQQNRVCDYQTLYRVQKKEIKEIMSIHSQILISIQSQVIGTQNKDVQVQTQNEEHRLQEEHNERVVYQIEISSRQQLQIEHTIEMQIQPYCPIQQPQNSIQDQEPTPKTVQNKQTQHESKLQLKALDTINIQPHRIQKRPFGLFKQINYQIEQPVLRTMKHSSLGQVFRFEGLKVQTLSVSANTNQQNLVIQTQIISEIVIPHSQTIAKTVQGPLNRLTIRKASSIEFHQSQSQNQLAQSFVIYEPPSIPIALEKQSILQVKESKDCILQQNELVQIVSPLARSLSQQRLQQHLQKHEIYEVAQQKESICPKNSPPPSNLVFVSQKQNNVQTVILTSEQNHDDKGEEVMNAKPTIQTNSILQTPTRCKQSYNQKLNSDTAYSYEISTFKDTPQQKNQPKKTIFTSYEQQIVSSYFFNMKAFQQIKQVSFQTPPEANNIFEQTNHMFVFSAHKSKTKSKFILWKGKIIHIGDKVSFMQMTQMKQLKIKSPSNNLILGNSEFIFIGNRLQINQANKIKIFKGAMPQGEWRVTKVTTYRTETGK